MENLLSTFDIDELAVLLPDSKKQLEELRKLSDLELDDSIEQDPASGVFEVPVILSFMVDETEAKDINLALDVIIRAEASTLSCGQALAHLARFHLLQFNPLSASKLSKE